MKCFHPEHSGIEVGIRFEKFLQRTAGNVPATRKRDVGMPRAQIGFQSDGERGFLHSLVKLKQMRMARADANPDYFHNALCGGKVPRARKREGKRREIQSRPVLSRKRELALPRVTSGKNPKGEMDLVVCGPANAANSVDLDRSRSARMDCGGSIETKSRVNFTFRPESARPALRRISVLTDRPGNGRCKVILHMRAIDIRK